MRLGIDLGGTKIEAALLDRDGVIRARARVPTPRDYAGSIAAIAGLIGETEAIGGARAATVGLAIPGSLSPLTGLVRNANSTWLNGKPLREDLAHALGRPVRLANDANCFALSEAVDGAAAGARVVFGVIIGTGCGGGVAIDGKVIDGASGVAGEWGHIPLPWPTEEEFSGPECWCGRRGCMELWVSGSGFKRWAGRSAEEAATAAKAGEAAARGQLDLLSQRLARGLAVVVDVLDPDVIVFGGGLSNMDGLCEGVRAHLGPWVFSDHVGARLVRNMHGDSSGVRGAAWLFAPEEI